MFEQSKKKEEKSTTTQSGPFASSKSGFELPDITEVMENLDTAINRAFVKTIGNEEFAKQREELKSIREDLYAMMSAEIKSAQMVEQIRSQLTKAHTQCGCM